MWAMTRKLGLSKLRSERTFLNFIDFSLQCVLELEDWCMEKRKMYWDRSKSFFCLRELIVSSDPRSAPQTAKKQCFLKSSLPRWLLSLERDNQLDFELILVDTCWLCVDTELALQSFILPALDITVQAWGPTMSLLGLDSTWHGFWIA